MRPLFRPPRQGRYNRIEQIIWQERLRLEARHRNYTFKSASSKNDGFRRIADIQAAGYTNQQQKITRDVAVGERSSSEIELRGIEVETQIHQSIA